MRIRTSTLLAAAVVLAACGQKRPAGAPADTAAAGMGGMAMTMRGMAMMPGMRAHLDSLAGMSPARMQAMMAAHQRLMSEMLDAMGADMRGMHMAADSAWMALADSVRRDLADLPGLAGPALGERMRAHLERVRRLMARHEAMMPR